jgi:hypothetical protein
MARIELISLRMLPPPTILISMVLVLPAFLVASRGGQFQSSARPGAAQALAGRAFPSTVIPEGIVSDESMSDRDLVPV